MVKLTAAVDGFLWDKQLTCSPTTVAKYRSLLGRFVAYMGDVDLAAVGAADARRFLVHIATTPGARGRTLSRRTVHDMWATLSSLWTWAERELGTPHIIRGKIAAPTYTDKTIDPLTAAQVRALLDATGYQRAYRLPSGKTARAKRPSGLRDRAIVLTLLDSGMRVSELCALTVGDYDPARGRLRIRHGKGDKERFTVVGSRARRALWRYLAERGQPPAGAPLFAVRSGRAMNRDNIRHMLNRLGEQAEVADVHPHRFRHTFAVTFLRNGGNPLLLQELLGHERLATVQIYVRLAERDIDAATRYSPADVWGVGA
jgi:site-specific recombinase XerD